MKWRAKDLENGLRNLLCDERFSAQVLSHPLVRSMGNTRAETQMVRWIAGGGLRDAFDRLTHAISQREYASKPDYLPAAAFAAALFDTLAPSTKGPLGKGLRPLKSPCT